MLYSDIKINLETAKKLPFKAQEFDTVICIEVLEHLNKELQMLELKNQIQNKTKMDLDRQQREYFLNQQIKTIQEELGGNNFEQEIAEFREKAKLKKWPDTVRETFEKQLSKLQRMHPHAAEHGIQTNYIELLLELPWNEKDPATIDLKNAEKILKRTLEVEGKYYTICCGNN